MEQTKKKAKKLLLVAVALMLVSMIGASIIQTNGGKVTVKELYFETDYGYGMSALLYKPNTATADNKAPAVVASHGAYNNKEMQDANYIELSRRGFVVLSVDQPNQGKSDIGGPGSTGVWAGVMMLSRLPYVDVTRIGVTGHSAGGGSCRTAVASDVSAGTNLISAVLLNSADATYLVSNEFANVYGSRDVGIISPVYDEFFFTSTDADGNRRSSPYFFETANAQSFLYFGEDPANQPKRNIDTVYTKWIDGKQASRIINRPAIIHPWSHFSTISTAWTIEFFDRTLGAPNSIESSSQVWNLKEALNFLGLIGFAIFIVNFAILMLFTSFFSVLRTEETVQPIQIDSKGKIWFWGSLIAGAIFSTLSFLPILTKASTVASARQSQIFAIACWAAACGLFTILCMFLSYRLYGKKNGFNLADRGVKIALPKLAKTVLLAVIVISVSYSWVFFADFFFKTDFRIWTLAMKTFTSKLLIISLFPYLVLFLIYYVAVSVAANCFNYNKIGGERSWVNTAILAVFGASPAIILLTVQYSTYFSANHMAWAQVPGIPGNPPMYIVWLFPMLLILSVTIVMSRAIYKVTRNPYLPGIINGILITLFSCINTTSRIIIPR